MCIYKGVSLYVYDCTCVEGKSSINLHMLEEKPHINMSTQIKLIAVTVNFRTFSLVKFCKIQQTGKKIWKKFHY